MYVYLKSKSGQGCRNMLNIWGGGGGRTLYSDLKFHTISLYSPDKAGFYWLDIKKVTHPTSFVYINNNKPVTWANWAGSEPDNQDEDCAATRAGAGVSL